MVEALHIRASIVDGRTPCIYCIGPLIAEAERGGDGGVGGVARLAVEPEHRVLVLCQPETLLRGVAQ